jgi:uncharacterized membrane protein YagU involved in acid resistance
MRKSFFASALTAGLIAGALDIIAACLHAYVARDTQPEQVLRYIASGVFGKDSASGNMMIVWGLLFHFLIAISFTFLFFLLTRMIPSLVNYPVPVAIAYGAFVWLFMRYIVLNYISTIKIRPITGKEAIINAIIGAVILMVCIGLPNALLARKYVRANPLT